MLPTNVNVSLKIIGKHVKIVDKLEFRHEWLERFRRRPRKSEYVSLNLTSCSNKMRQGCIIRPDECDCSCHSREMLSVHLIPCCEYCDICSKNVRGSLQQHKQQHTDDIVKELEIMKKLAKLV